MSKDYHQPSLWDQDQFKSTANGATPRVDPTIFLLQNLMDGTYLPGQYTWEEAQAMLEILPLCRVRRLDEALEERS